MGEKEGKGILALNTNSTMANGKTIVSMVKEYTKINARIKNTLENSKRTSIMEMANYQVGTTATRASSSKVRSRLKASELTIGQDKTSKGREDMSTADILGKTSSRQKVSTNQHNHSIFILDLTPKGNQL